MSRGAQQTTQQLTQQLASQNQLISQANQQGQQDRSVLMPGIEQLINNPGYTPAQQSAITQEGMGSAKSFAAGAAKSNSVRQRANRPAHGGLERARANIRRRHEFAGTRDGRAA